MSSCMIRGLLALALALLAGCEQRPAGNRQHPPPAAETKATPSPPAAVEDAPGAAGRPRRPVAAPAPRL